MADLVQVVGVRDDHLAAFELQHVELDEVDSGSDRGPEGRDRVLRRERGRAAVPDPEHPAVSSLERDHGAFGRVGR